MTYDVHLYAVVRVKVPGVEADSQKEAIPKALAAVDLDQQFGAEEFEYADEIVGYLVDEQGDEEYERSCWYLDKTHADVQKELIDRGVEVV